MDTRDMKFKSPELATPVVGPSGGWFVHHPNGFLIECGTEPHARRVAFEINAGRSSMMSAASMVSEEVRESLRQARVTPPIPWTDGI